MSDKKKTDSIETIVLSKESSGRVADLLINPPPPSPAMIRAKERHEQLIGPIEKVDAARFKELSKILDNPPSGEGYERLKNTPKPWK